MDYKSLIRSFAAVAAVFSFIACVEEEYEVSEDRINLEVGLFQEGLTAPLGSTDFVSMRDLLEKFYPEHKDWLKIADGAYAFNMKDTFSLTDSLKNLQELIDIPDVAVSKDIEFALEGVDVSDMVVGPFGYEYSEYLSDVVDVPEISIPQVSGDYGFSAGLNEYVPEDMDIDLPAMSYETSFATITGNVNIPESLRNDNPIQVSPDKVFDGAGAGLTLSTGFGPLTHTLSFEVALPEGIKSVEDIVLGENARAVLAVELRNSFFHGGKIKPHMDLDLHDVFSIEGSEDGHIVTDFSIDAAGGRMVKEFGIGSLVFGEGDWQTDAQGRLVLKKTVDLEVSGSIAYDGVTTTTNLLAGASAMDTDISLSVEFVDFAIEDAVMEIEPLVLDWEKDILFDLPAIKLPEGVKGVNYLKFATGSGIDVAIDVSNVISGLGLSLESLEITFPDEIDVKGAVNGKVVFSDDDLKDGFEDRIVFRSISLPKPTGGVISFNESLKVKAVTRAEGVVCSSELPVNASDDLKVDVSFASDLEIDDYSVSVDGLGVDINISEEFSAVLPSEMKDMGTVTVRPEGSPAIVIDVELPEVGIPVVASREGLKMIFPTMLELGTLPSKYNYDKEENSICIYGELPDHIELPIESISVTPAVDEADGSCYAKGVVKVVGGLSFSTKDLSKAKVEAITAPGTKAAVRISIPELKPSTLSLDSYSSAISQEFEIEFLKPGDVPEEVVAVETIGLDDVCINLSLDASALPDLGDADLVVDLSVDLPDMVVLADGQQDADGNLKITGKLDKDGMIKVNPIRIEALDLSGVDLSKGIKETISVEGSVSISDVSLDVDEWLGKDKKHKVVFDASIKDIAVSDISAKVNYQIDPVEETLDLTGIKSTLSDNNLNLSIDISHAHLALDLLTDLSVSASAYVELVPYHGAKAGDPVTVSLEVEGAEPGSVPRNTKFWLGDSEECCPAGYQFKKVAILDALNPIPDSVQVKFLAGTDPDALCAVDLKKNYTLEAEYALEIPLAFGEDLRIEYRDTIEVDPGVINAVLEVGNLALTGKAESSLPFDLSFEARMLDENKHEVEFADGSGVLKISGSPDGSPVSSDLKFMFVKKEGVKLPDVAAIEVMFSISSAGDAVRMRPDSYVKAELQVLIPDGVSVDLKDFINKEEE
jgi:hypothetical protein